MSHGGPEGGQTRAPALERDKDIFGFSKEERQRKLATKEIELDEPYRIIATLFNIEVVAEGREIVMVSICKGDKPVFEFTVGDQGLERAGRLEISFGEEASADLERGTTIGYQGSTDTLLIDGSLTGRFEELAKQFADWIEYSLKKGSIVEVP